ncbi:unnamed protein product [Thlaspi arvense]|uniref:Uncharacterized protein n=1 Tax=Thlaspi arvense TaxID=13288 RepID=A0AAU9T5J9_THLAR|nr:unnamed protein product [Thlaspi arvense]
MYPASSNDKACNNFAQKYFIDIAESSNEDKLQLLEAITRTFRNNEDAWDHHMSPNSGGLSSSSPSLVDNSIGGVWTPNSQQWGIPPNAQQWGSSQAALQWRTPPCSTMGHTTKCSTMAHTTERTTMTHTTERSTMGHTTEYSTTGVCTKPDTKLSTRGVIRNSSHQFSLWIFSWKSRTKDILKEHQSKLKDVWDGEIFGINYNKIMLFIFIYSECYCHVSQHYVIRFKHIMDYSQHYI